MSRSKALAALLLAAFAVRAGWCLARPQGAPGGGMRDIDGYHLLATSLVERRGFYLDGKVSADREPGYSVLLAALYLVFGPRYWPVALLHCLLGAFTVLLVFLLGEEVFGERAAWIAAALAAFYPQFIYYTALPVRETLLVFLAATGSWLLVRRRAGWAGAVWAWLAACNSAWLPAGGALSAGLLRTDRRRAALYVAVFTCLYGLWPLRNYIQFGRFVLGISGGSERLYIQLILPNDAAGTPRAQGYLDADPVLVRTRTLPKAEVDRILYPEALRWIRLHPLGYARLVLGNIVKLWRLYPYNREYGVSYRLVKWVSLLSDGWIIPLGLAGLILAGRSRPQADYFLIVLACVTLTHVLFWPIIRYRLPMMPLVFLYAAHALDRLAARLRA